MFKLPRKSDQVTMNNALLKACIAYTHMYRIVYASGSNYNLLFIIIFYIKNAMLCMHGTVEIGNCNVNATKFSSSRFVSLCRNNFYENCVECRFWPECIHTISCEVGNIYKSI